MKNYKKIHRALWGLLIATGAVTTDELQLFGIKEEIAQQHLNWILDLIESEVQRTDVDIVKVTFTINSNKIIGKLKDDPSQTFLL